jgi:hypothetical protein
MTIESAYAYADNLVLEGFRTEIANTKRKFFDFESSEY